MRITLLRAKWPTYTVRAFFIGQAQFLTIRRLVVTEPFGKVLARKTVIRSGIRQAAFCLPEIEHAAPYGTN